MSRLKVCLPALLALSLALPAMAAAQANVSGPWEVTIDSPQGAMSIDADLKQDGEALTGMITSPMGNVELKGTFKNNELAFSYSVPLQGQNLDITMTGKLAGDTIDGLVTIAGLGEVPWKAKRKTARRGRRQGCRRARGRRFRVSGASRHRPGGHRQVGHPHGHAGRSDAVHGQLRPDRRKGVGHGLGPDRRNADHRHDDRQRPEDGHEHSDAAGRAGDQVLRRSQPARV